MAQEVEVAQDADEWDESGESEAEKSEKEEIGGVKAYVIECILGEREHNGKKEYLVSWEGYSESEATWEPEDGIQAEEKLAAYRAKVTASSSPSSSFSSSSSASTTKRSRAARCVSRSVNNKRKRPKSPVIIVCSECDCNYESVSGKTSKCVGCR